MIGIYKYTNKINNHIYIGQSVDIETRKKNHYYSSRSVKAKDYNTQFHQAIRKYGIENFDFEILVELSPEEYSRELLNALEKHFIKIYNSYKNGYNATEGGDDILGNSVHKGSKNGRALLTEEDVIYIRECYNSHIPFRIVYEEYKEKISKRGLQKIWWFDTWKHIYPEYETEENKYWHSHNAKANSSKVAANNKRAFSKEEVLQMRKDFAEGKSIPDIWRQYAPDKAKSTIYNLVMKITYKDII